MKTSILILLIILVIILILLYFLKQKEILLPQVAIILITISSFLLVNIGYDLYTNYQKNYKFSSLKIKINKDITLFDFDKLFNDIKQKSKSDGVMLDRQDKELMINTDKDGNIIKFSLNIKIIKNKYLVYYNSRIKNDYIHFDFYFYWKINSSNFENDLFLSDYEAIIAKALDFTKSKKELIIEILTYRKCYNRQLNGQFLVNNQLIDCLYSSDELNEPFICIVIHEKIELYPYYYMTYKFYSRETL